MEEPDLTLVSMAFDSDRPEELLAVLARYVVLARGAPGCRNVDLAASATRPGRFVVHQKWVDAESQRAHFDSDVMVEMASAATPLLDCPPEIDLLLPISAHDLE